MDTSPADFEDDGQRRCLAVTAELAGAAGLPDARQTLHGTMVACAGSGILFRGPSGRGKSDLALRMILSSSLPGGSFHLVADDRVCLLPVDAALRASAPAPLFGLIEVRGLGLVRMPALADCRLCVAIDLVDPADVPRFPAILDESDRFTVLAGFRVPRHWLCAWEHSAPIKAALALQQALLASSGSALGSATPWSRSDAALNLGDAFPLLRESRPD